MSKNLCRYLHHRVFTGSGCGSHDPCVATPTFVATIPVIFEENDAQGLHGLEVMRLKPGLDKVLLNISNRRPSS